MTASSWVGWATTLSAVLICATPPHRCALHRRQRGSSAPLLPIAALCIVVSAAHLRHSSPSLRSASSSARLICATPPHRCALHRRQRGSSAPLLTDLRQQLRRSLYPYCIPIGTAFRNCRRPPRDGARA